jgi:hypothetical protein
MPFTISPGVVTKEIDLTTIVPEISMTEGAIAGPFKWGPTYDRVTVSNESELTSSFGKPNAATYKTYFTAVKHKVERLWFINFLPYYFYLSFYSSLKS